MDLKEQLLAMMMETLEQYLTKGCSYCNAEEHKKFNDYNKRLRSCFGFNYESKTLNEAYSQTVNERNQLLFEMMETLEDYETDGGYYSDGIPSEDIRDFKIDLKNIFDFDYEEHKEKKEDILRKEYSIQQEEHERKVMWVEVPRPIIHEKPKASRTIWEILDDNMYIILGIGVILNVVGYILKYL